MLPDKRLLYAAGSVLVIFIGLMIFGRYSAGAARDAQVQADILAGRNAELENRVKAGIADLASSGVRNKALSDRIDELLRTRTKAPPKPEVVPVTDAELTLTLLGKGLSDGLMIKDLPSSTLNPYDARKAYSWEQEAARIPAFEMKSAADDLLITQQGLLVGGLKDDIVKCKDLVLVREYQVGVVNAETEALRKANDALLKVQVAERWKTKIKLGVGLPLAAYLGYRLTK